MGTLLILHQNAANDSFLQVSSNVQSKTTSVNFLNLVPIKGRSAISQLETFYPCVMALRFHVGYLENTGSLSEVP